MPNIFSTRFSNDDLCLLMELGKKYSFDPLSSCECENYFAEVLQKCSEGQGNKRIIVEDIVSKSFTSCEHKPHWVQTPDWLFEMGKPMFFVGQNEITIVKGDISFYYTFYIFWNPVTGNVKTIVQSD